LIEVPEPRIESPEQVMLRVLDVGICGTDREIASFHYGTPPPGEAALIIGHESLAEVVAVGSGVSRVAVGDLVVPSVRRPCPHDSCTACRAERQDFCYTGDFRERGIKELPGFLSELAVEHESYLNVVPRQLAEIGVLVEPLTIAEKALAEVAQVQKRLPWSCAAEHHKQWGHCHTALVLGAGPVGLLGAMALAAADFDVFVYSREGGDSAQAQLIAQMGARYLSSQDTSVDQLSEVIGQIDLIYEATGASALSFDVMRVLGTNGIFVFTGVPGRKGPVKIDTDLIMRNLVLKNQIVFGTVNAARQSFEDAIRDLGTLAQRWPEAVRGLITGRYALEEVDGLLLGEAQGIKNVIRLTSPLPPPWKGGGGAC